MAKINKRDSKGAFTIIELFVVLVIVFILAAVAMPRFMNAQDDERQARVKLNMKIVQIAAESYATDHQGHYPASANDKLFRCYFPGGSNDSQAPKGGQYPINPFTNSAQAPLAGAVVDVQATRMMAPASLGGASVAGAIFYTPIVKPGDNEPTSYIIEGADKNGMAIAGTVPNSTFVLSNQ